MRRFLPFPCFTLVVLWLVLPAPPLVAQTRTVCCTVRVTVKDATGLPIGGAYVELERDEQRFGAATTATSPAVITVPGRGSYRLKASADGLAPILRVLSVHDESSPDIEVVLSTPLPRSESVTVTADGARLEQASSPAASAGRGEASQVPSQPATLREALPLMPGVIRTPEGKLNIVDAPEHRSALLINSLDVTDPATGEFGATIPIDAVAQMSVYKNPFLAEYGKFTAGVVTVETERGTGKWRYELNDPTPELRIRSGRLVGVRAFTPRFSTTGPLIAGKLYVSLAGEYILKKTPVFTLQFPANEDRREMWNGLAQLDYIPNASHLITLTTHVVPQKHAFAQIGFYSPKPTTPTNRGHEARASLADRYTFGGGQLETAISVGQAYTRVYPQGDLPLEITPDGNEGNYFLTQNRKAERWQWLETYSLPPQAKWGTHHWKVGGVAAVTRIRGDYAAKPILIRDWNGLLLERYDFTNFPGYRSRDIETSAFAQDHWIVKPSLSVDAGVRVDGQSRSSAWRVGPRLGVAWTPTQRSNTILRSGMGWFYDRVPLNVYGFDSYPERSLTVLTGGGIAAPPVTFRNVLEALPSAQGPLVFRSQQPGNFAPQSFTWNAQVEHRFPKWTSLRVTYLESRSSGLIVLNPLLAEAQAIMQLGGGGRALTRQTELVSLWSLREGMKLYASYVYTNTRANLNDFNSFLADYPAPVIRRDFRVEPNANIPHRFLTWGIIPLGWGLRISPTIEWRTGFPWSGFDERQRYAGTPNTYRFPNFFSLDLRVSKEIQWRKHAFMVSVSGFNLTNHWNPDTVRWNTADPQFGQFFGNRVGRLRVDFDFLY